ncbi:hypothetical protein CHUAL_004184 [Chamberlinius hualienensis]
MGLLLIIILIWFSIFQSGVCQSHKFVADHEVFEVDGSRIYKCKFRLKVDCLWQKDGKTFSLKSYNFSYINGNGINTKDCSITGSNYTVASKFDNLQCIGMTQLRPVIEISAAKLNCKSKERVSCSWKRNDQFVIIKGRYRYIDGHNGSDVSDCSIEIFDIQLIDQGKWTCFHVTVDGSDYYLSAAYKLHLNNETTTISNETTTISNETTTISNEKQNNCSDVNRPISTSIQSQDVNHLIVYLPIIGILTAVIIRLVIYVRKIQVSLRNAKNAIEMNLAEFNKPPNMSGQTETDEYLIPMDPKTRIESTAERERIKPHLYEQLKLNSNRH